MKHHPSEHIFKFQVSNNNTILEDAYILQQNPLSDIDPAPLAPKAQEAARRYLSRAKTAKPGVEAKGKAGDFVPSPPPLTQPPPGWNMGADNATNRIIQEAEIRRRAFVASTSTPLGSPFVLLNTSGAGPPPPPPTPPPEATPEDETPKHQLDATGVATGSPTLGKPELTENLPPIDAIPPQTSAASQFTLNDAGEDRPHPRSTRPRRFSPARPLCGDAPESGRAIRPWPQRAW